MQQPHCSTPAFIGQHGLFPWTLQDQIAHGNYDEQQNWHAPGTLSCADLHKSWFTFSNKLRCEACAEPRSAARSGKLGVSTECSALAAARQKSMQQTKSYLILGSAPLRNICSVFPGVKRRRKETSVVALVCTSHGLRHCPPPPPPRRYGRNAYVDIAAETT